MSDNTNDTPPPPTPSRTTTANASKASASKAIDWATAKLGQKVDPDNAKSVDVEAANEVLKATDLKLVNDAEVPGGLVVTNVSI